MTDLKEYRTWSVAVIAIVALCLCATVGGVKGDELGHVEWGLGIYVGAVAGRAISALASNGSGFKGIKDVLLTNAKPGDPPSPAVQP